MVMYIFAHMSMQEVYVKWHNLLYTL